MERLVNGQKYDVYKEGSESPFAFVPGGTKQICDSSTQKYLLVKLEKEKIEDLRQLCDEQCNMILALNKELKDTQDELVKKDEEISRLTAQINVLNPGKKR